MTTPNTEPEGPRLTAAQIEAWEREALRRCPSTYDVGAPNLRVIAYGEVTQAAVLMRDGLSRIASLEAKLAAAERERDEARVERDQRVGMVCERDDEIAKAIEIIDWRSMELGEGIVEAVRWLKAQHRDAEARALAAGKQATGEGVRACVQKMVDWHFTGEDEFKAKHGEHEWERLMYSSDTHELLAIEMQKALAAPAPSNPEARGEAPKPRMANDAERLEAFRAILLNPAVNVGSDGTTIDWWNRERNLTLTLCGEETGILRSWGSDTEKEMSEHEFDPITFHEHLAWIMSDAKPRPATKQDERLVRLREWCIKTGVHSDYVDRMDLVREIDRLLAEGDAGAGREEGKARGLVNEVISALTAPNRSEHQRVRDAILTIAQAVEPLR